MASRMSLVLAASPVLLGLACHRATIAAYAGRVGEKLYTDLAQWWNAGQLSGDEQKMSAALVGLVDADPDVEVDLEVSNLLLSGKRKRRSITQPFIQGAINDARSKVGYLRDTPSNRLVVSTTMLRYYKEGGVRAFDVSRHLPIAIELFFVPTQAELEVSALVQSKAFLERKVEALCKRRPTMGWWERLRWFFGWGGPPKSWAS